MVCGCRNEWPPLFFTCPELNQAISADLFIRLSGLESFARRETQKYIFPIHFSLSQGRYGGKISLQINHSKMFDIRGDGKFAEEETHGEEPKNAKDSFPLPFVFSIG